MAKTQRLLAKLTRPRLHKALGRERLFQKLDQARDQHQALCVIGPPGAGKTTLVASWHDDRRVNGVWFQVDPGDADPATFFYYLCAAGARFTRKGQRSLPLLTPDYVIDLPTFSRRFFRELFARMPSGATLVLDNYQEVPADNILHRLVADAVQEVPPSSTLLVISRRDPPDCYTRLVANQHVAFIDWSDLRLTLEETRSIASTLSPQAHASVDELHTKTGGWAAGLTLLLQRAQRTASPAPLGQPEYLQDVFDYLAAQVFAELGQTHQELLLQLAPVPQFTAEFAQRLTGDPSAVKLLETLHRRHLFIDRRGGIEPSYQFHPLFRTFLQHRAQEYFGQTTREALIRAAATLLEDAGAWDAAFELRCQLQDWATIRTLVKKHARALLHQGRSQTLRAWIDALPQAERVANSWVSYWYGIALLPIDPAAARQALETAFKGFQNSEDLVPQLLATSGLIDSYYFEWRDDHPLDRWVAVMDALLEQPVRFDSLEDELRPHVSIVAAAIRRAPGHRRLRSSVAKIVSMLDQRLPPEIAVNAASVVLNYLHFVPDLPLLNAVTAAVTPRLDHDSVSPASRIHWFGRLAFCRHREGKHEAALECADKAIALVHAEGLRHFLGFLYFFRGLACYGLGRSQELRLTLRQYEAVVDDRRPLEYNGVCLLRACLAHLESNLPEARRSLEAAVRTADASGLVPLQAWDRVELAATLAALGEPTEFRRVISYTRGMLALTPFTYLGRSLDLIEAWRALKDGGRPRCHALLRQTLAPVRSECMTRDYLPYAPPALKSEIFAEAVRANIEVDTVRDIIRCYRVQPTVGMQDTWPWPVKVYTLGRFELIVEDSPVVFGRKLPRKALALLKLIVCGGINGVSEKHVMDALWPDEDGDMAYQSLTSTVYRLRKWVRVEGAIKQQGGTLSLDAAQCWVDAWALLEAHDDTAVNLLDRYQGLFLPDDQDVAWTGPMRERLRKRSVASAAR